MRSLSHASPIAGGKTTYTLCSHILHDLDTQQRAFMQRCALQHAYAPGWQQQALFCGSVLHGLDVVDVYLRSRS
jgi:hypothetical protein